MYMKKDKMIEKILGNIILKQNQRVGFKGFSHRLYRFDFGNK